MRKKWCFAQVHNALQNNSLTWRNPWNILYLPTVKRNLAVDGMLYLMEIYVGELVIHMREI